ncbi:MAG: hypothetical protein WCA48_22210 [Pseudomonas gingeri]
MDQERDTKIWAQYPAILSNSLAPAHHYPWRSVCGDGWYDLIDTLCSSLQAHIDQQQAEPISVVGIKEKFGQLRVDYRGGDAATRAMIQLVTSLSVRVCEICGNRGHTLSDQRWVRTRCEAHRDTSYTL